MSKECVKDIYYIRMGYRVNEPDENGNFEYSETTLDEKVKVSIPYDEGIYVLGCENGVAYDMNTEYIDGNYVFETNKLGTFMLSTESTGRTEPTKTENVELKQQTITDERTGVKVSGMLPVDAKMDVSLYCVDDLSFSDRYDFPYLYENDYPEVSNIYEFLYEYDFEREYEDISKLMDHEGWAEHEVTAGGKIVCAIQFAKDFEIVDFDSDLTITLPFDYHNALAISQLLNDPGKAKAVQYDYDKKEFVTLEIIPAENTEKGEFQFKAKTAGRYHIGGEVNIDRSVNFYKEQANYIVKE